MAARRPHVPVALLAPRHHELAAGEDVELFFITGADALAQILSWKDHDDIWSLAHFVGVTRPEHELSGALVITSRRPTPTSLRQSVESLASTVSLALESAAGVPLGLEVEAFAVPGKVPLFQEAPDGADPGRQHRPDELAIEQGADGLECDVRLTGLFHESTESRSPEEAFQLRQLVRQVIQATSAVRSTARANPSQGPRRTQTVAGGSPTSASMRPMRAPDWSTWRGWTSISIAPSSMAMPSSARSR